MSVFLSRADPVWGVGYDRIFGSKAPFDVPAIAQIQRGIAYGFDPHAAIT
jgi:hypothetical protein